MALANRRLLTAPEIEKILGAISNFRINKSFKSVHDENVFEALRNNLRPFFSDILVSDHPDIVKHLREKLRRKFLCCLLVPGISDGSRASSANTEPINQSTLKSTQSAGAKNLGNPINELLSVAATRVAEYIYTSLYCYMPVPEWYMFRSYDSIRELVVEPPPDIDTVLAEAMDMISPPIETIIVRKPNGAMCNTSKISGDSGNPMLKILPSCDPAKSYVFHTVRFSVTEALKLRRTPFDILSAIDDFLDSDSNSFLGTSVCKAGITANTPTYFEISIWSEDSTVGFAATQSIVNIGKNTTGLASFEILHTPTTACITDVEIIDTRRLGKLASMKLDGTPAKMWIVYLLNPMSLVPPEHLCYFLSYLGFQIAGVERNAVGRVIKLRIAEWKCSVDGKLLDWISKASTSEKTSTPVGNIVSWRSENSDKMLPYSMFYVVKYRAHIKKKVQKKPKKSTKKPDENTFEYFVGNHRYLWSQTYTNVIPTMTKVMCATSARHAMDREWITSVAGTKVSQSGADYVTMYACHIGPVPQAITHVSIGTGGPLAAMNEDPNKVFTNSATRGLVYTADGSQSNIVLGSTSNCNGASSVQVKEIYHEGTLSYGIVEKGALTSDSTVKSYKTPIPDEDEQPLFSLM
jgi:hypothetical protein